MNYKVTLIGLFIVLNLFGCSNNDKLDKPVNEIENKAKKIGERTKEDNENTYILENSDKVEISREILKKLSIDDLNLARNEIYARHGYIFKTENYSDYFLRKSWYTENANFSINDFNTIEKKNINILVNYINEKKSNKILLMNDGDSYDLNNDGKKDNIKITFSKDSSQYKLEINSSIVSSDSGGNYDNMVYIYYIGKNSDLQSIAIFDNGPSSDFFIDFYQYDGSNINFIGKVPGYADILEVVDSGNLKTQKRGSILHTWFYDAIYELKNSKLEFVEQDYYNMNCEISMLDNLEVQKSPTDTSIVFELNTGDKATITKSDDKKWCEIKNSSNDIGYFEVINFSQINGKDANDIFYGLCNAD